MMLLQPCTDFTTKSPFRFENGRIPNWIDLLEAIACHKLYLFIADKKCLDNYILCKSFQDIACSGQDNIRNLKVILLVLVTALSI